MGESEEWNRRKKKENKIDTNQKIEQMRGHER